jgi:NAD(P)H-quinone oxidoreductase subunit 5
MQITDLLHPLAIPLAPLLGGIAARALPGHSPRISPASAVAACGLAILLAVLPRAADPGLARLDELAVTMALLVSFLGAVVLRFAARYLEGDPARPRFLFWMDLTLAAVLTMAVSNHLLMLAGAWLATSLCLHRLLLHHPDRPGAVFAARKKFVFSRIAELLLLAAILMIHHGHGTWRIDELAASIAAGNHAGLPVAALLLALCAMLKSAQFPFHSWLPDTMDTPTPVSAFMHAGIINGGGFLVLRLAPVFAAAPVSLHLLAVAGTITAAFGAIVMLPQPGVKRSLAYSTIAQMGFMMIQCGLGAWGLALLHLVAHALYKAHAFLHAGSAIGATPRAAVPLATPALALGVVAGTTVVTVAVSFMHGLFPQVAPVPVAFHVILALALAYGIGRAWSGHRASLTRALAAAGGIAAAALGLHLAAGLVLPDASAHRSPGWLVAWVAAVFTLLFLFQSLLWRASAHPLGRILYIHALNGFYIGTAANRLLGRLWPSRSLP